MNLDDECIHGLPPYSCTMCKNSAAVFVTDGGWGKYHLTTDCPGIASGQGLVTARTGYVGNIHRTTVGSRKIDGRDPCLVCRPPRRS